LITRIGIVRRVVMQEDLEHTAAELIRQFAPGADGELLDDAVDALAKAGNARTLKKQLNLAREIREGGRDKAWAACFAAAATQLIKPARRQAA
jgi:hypothetical protein